MRLHALWAVGLCSVLMGCASQRRARERDEVSSLDPAAVINLEIKVYRFRWFDSDSKQDGIIAYSEGDGGYSLIYAPEKITICGGVYYVKTFGGAAPTVEVYLINGRFVAYPETLRNSEIENELFHDRMAVTRVFDLKKGKLVHTSHPYQYHHDAPLVLGRCWLLGAREK